MHALCHCDPVRSQPGKLSPGIFDGIEHTIVKAATAPMHCMDVPVPVKLNCREGGISLSQISLEKGHLEGTFSSNTDKPITWNDSSGSRNRWREVLHNLEQPRSNVGTNPVPMGTLCSPVKRP